MRKSRAPLGRRPDLPREAKAAQPLDEPIVELRQPGQIGELVLIEAQRLNPLQRLLQPGREQKTPAARQAARAELEDRRRNNAPLVVKLRHHQLVEVGEQPRRGNRPGPHADAPRSMTAPAAANSASAASPSPASRFTAATALVTTVVSKPSASASNAVAFTQ